MQFEIFLIQMKDEKCYFLAHCGGVKKKMPISGTLIIRNLFFSLMLDFQFYFSSEKKDQLEYIKVKLKKNRVKCFVFTKVRQWALYLILIFQDKSI